ncbi:MAG: sodium:solute symporter [Pseudobdellovibrionaceae bacterium]
MDTKIFGAIALISLYFMVLLICVVRSRYSETGRIVPSAEEFFLASRSLKTPVLIATFIGTLFSAFTVAGVPSAVYANGIADWIWLIGGAAIMVLALALFSRFFFRLSQGNKDILSPIELVAKHYRTKSLGALLAVTILIFLTPYLAIQLVGMGKLLEGVSGGAIGYFDGVGFIMAIILFYLLFGGMRAVAYTDYVQAVMIFVGIIGTVTLFITHYFGDLPAMIAAVKEKAPQQFNPMGNHNQYTVPLLISNMFFIGLLVVSQPQLLTRLMMAEKERQIHLIVIVSALCMVIGYGGGALLGLGGSVVFPDLPEANLLPGKIMSAMMDLHLFGLVTAGFLLIGVISASMSTADSLLIAIGQLFIRDIARPYIKLTPEKQVKLAKLLMIVVLGIAFLLGIKPPPVMIDLASYSFMGTSILAPIVLASLSEKWRNKTAAFLAVLLGEGAFILLMVMGIKPFGFHASFAALAISTVIVILGYMAKKAGLTKTRKTA